MLTTKEKQEIREMLLEGKLSIFKISSETQHSPHTIRKVKKELEGEVNQSNPNVQKDKGDNFTLIPVEIGFLAELLMEKTISPEYQVFLPVSWETAEQFIRIEKMFKELDPLLKDMANAAKKGFEDKYGGILPDAKFKT